MYVFVKFVKPKTERKGRVQFKVLQTKNKLKNILNKLTCDETIVLFIVMLRQRDGFLDSLFHNLQTLAILHNVFGSR